MLSMLCLPPFGSFLSVCHLACFSFNLFPCLSAGLISLVFACTCMEHRHLEQGCDLLGASKNGKDGNKKMQTNKGQRSVD